LGFKEDEVAEKSDEMQMSMNPRIERDREAIIRSRGKGRVALLGTFFRLSGPGWLQSAITLGGGSLASSLYLGVLVGFSFLWLQPLAMILGVIMLSAIGYVTLSTGMRPFRAINEHVNPVLGWGWIIACMMANIVWSMPQFALGTAAIQQNLLPGVVGVEAMGEPWGKIIAGLSILAVAITFVMFYNAGGRGVKIFEIIVKMMVGMIVVCFFGVVVKLSIEGAMDWSKVRSGLIPDLGLLFRPADTFAPFIGAVGEKFQAFWETLIIRQQRDVMISAASTAVGINMTFLLPYSMLRKGWGKDFRGLAIFDLSTGLFIPFILVTGCVVMASASQFHAVAAEGFLGQVDTNGKMVAPAQNLVSGYNDLMQSRLKYEVGDGFEKLSIKDKAAMVEAMPVADKKMAAMLVKRDAFNLADTLSPLTGKVFSRYMFGLGVLGMAISASTMLMLINGLVFCEMLNKPAKGWPQRIGCLMVSVGVLGPFFWKGAKLWLAIPTSVFAMVLLPIAYFTFYMLMNQRSLLGDKMPRGCKRVAWNVLMAIAAGSATFISVWTLWSKLQWIGIGVMGAFIGLVLIVQICRKPNKQKM
jgi:Mn2+/Fe2+ NRAMP family transporter